MAISDIAKFIEIWHMPDMPLMFALAGASIFFALVFCKPGRYIAERFKRLLIPFVLYNNQ